MSTTYVIADVHGRYDLLLKANRMIAERGGNRWVICLGDFIDRGPDSFGCIALMEQHRWTVLQGNHEDIMLQVLEKPGLLRWWLSNGGGPTLMSFGHPAQGTFDPTVVPEVVVKWLKGLPIFYEDEHRIYVHGGLRHDLDPEDHDKHTLQWGLYSDEFPDSTQLADLPHKSGKHIVHGHHQSETHPLLLPHRTNLDAFAWKTGRLAIGVFDDDTPGGPVEILWSEA